MSPGRAFMMLALLVCCLLISACNVDAAGDKLPTPDENNIIYVTATPAAAQPQATNTDPPPPPSEAPNPDAERLLQRAENLLRDGYLDEALAAFRQLLSRGEAAAADRAQAALRLGQAALQAGDFQAARDEFDALIARFPDSGPAHQAYFLRGDAKLGLSRWQAAINDYETYLKLRPGLIDSYAHERIADARIALSQTDAALRSYQQSLASGRALLPQLILREKLARIAISLSQPDLALAQYDAVLEVARNAPYRAEIAFAAAQTLLEAGREEAGLARMQVVFNGYPGTSFAYQAARALLEAGVALEPYKLGKSAFTAGDLEQAVSAFEAVVTSNEPAAAIPAELYLLLGRAYRQIGKQGAAAVAFQRIIDRYPQDPLFGDALLERGRSRFLAGDVPSAIAIYLGIADSYSQLERVAGEALWRAGYLHHTRGESARARDIFSRLARDYPQHELSANGMTIAAEAALSAEDWQLAERLYDQVASLTRADEKAEAHLWTGRLAARRGDHEAASKSFQAAIDAASDSFFAARADDFLHGRAMFQRPAELRFDFDFEADVGAAEAWLRATFAIEQGGPLWRLSDELAADARMIRGRELLALGAYEDAAAEFDDLVDEARDNRDPVASYQLALHLRGLGVYRESIVAAANLINASGQGSLRTPPFIARLRFPAYYLDPILRAANERGLDPLLMLSIIRLESLFNTFATAAAGEKGLMQVIPGTAQYIAEQLAWQDYQHSDLFRPYAGIAFGAYYIDEQLRVFDQNPVVALAAYNAGPGRAYQWNADADGDPERFMKAISIDWTRKYVEYTYRNYNIYRALYSGG